MTETPTQRTARTSNRSAAALAFLTALLVSLGLFASVQAVWADDDPPEIRELRIEPLEIALAPGESTTLTVYAVYDDESETRLTSDLEFQIKDDRVARIDGFVLTAVGGGDTRIQVEHNGTGANEADPANLTVWEITEIEISPRTLSLQEGEEAQLRAYATLENGQSGFDITETVDWESGKRSVVEVSNDPGLKGKVYALREGEAEISAEHRESGEHSDERSAVVTVDEDGGSGGGGGSEESEIKRLRAEPSEIDLLPGETVQLRVIAQLKSDEELDVTSECTFESRREKTATVSATGLVTAGESGSAKIQIEHSSGEDPKRDPEIRVGEVERLAIDPVRPTMEVGGTLALRAIATYDNGRSADLTTQVEWSSSKTSVARVGDSGSAKGRITALAPGEAVIIARDRESGEKSEKDDGRLRVLADGEEPPDGEDEERRIRDIRNLVFEPAVLYLRPGESRSVHVTALYDDGWTEDVTEHVELRVRNRKVASAGDGALITALKGGDSQVRARYKAAGRNSRIPLELVVSRMSNLRVVPASIGLAPGESTQLRAFATYNDSSAEVDVTEFVEWESDRERTAVVDNAAARGLLTAIEEGDAKIQVEDPQSGVRSDRSTGRVEVGDDVEPGGSVGSATEIVGLAFDPPNLSLSIGASAPFQVYGVLENGERTAIDHSELRLQVESRRVAVLDGNDRIEARRGGSTELRAEHRDSETEATLPVGVREIIRLEISPATTALRVGDTVQLRALAEMNDGTSGVDVTDQVEWRSRNRSIVSVDDRENKGLVSGDEAGTGRIEIRHRDSRTASDASTGNVSVVADLQKIYVEPERVLADVGKRYNFEAYAIFADGSTVEISDSVVWTLSNSAVATIDSDGELTMRASGEVTIKATDLDTGISSTLSGGDAIATTLSGGGGGGGGGGDPEILGLQVSTERDELVDTPVALTLAPGDSRQLYALLSVEGEDRPFDRTDESLWFSTNEDAVPVENGRVTCRELGDARISAALADGSVTSTGSLGDADINCSAADVASLKIVPASKNLDYGKSTQLRAYRVYADGSEVEVTQKVIWESERPAAVSVIESGDQAGRVTAHGDAIVDIIAYDPDFDISSDDADTNASIGVRKTRTRLQIFPIYPLPDSDGVHRGRVGELMILKAKVWYKSGVTRGVNLLVDWESSDTDVIVMGTGRQSDSEFKVNQGQMLTTGQVTITATWPADEFSSDLDYSIEVEVLP